MKQLAPDLFARRFGDLMEIGRARLPALAPEWTDHNAHDPGITLMELLAWVTEAQLYSLSPRPRRDERAAYAALVGLETGGARPARGVLWADPRDPRSPAATYAKSVAIPVDAVVHLLDAETPTFRPTHRLLWAPGRIAKLESRLADGRTVDLTATNERGGVAFLPFGERAGRRDVLAMTFEGRDENGLFGVHPKDKRRRAETKGALWAIGVRAAPPLGGAAAEAGEPPRQCHSPLAATLVADGRRIAVRIAADSSEGLLRSGVLLLDLDAVPGSPREVTLELRAVDGLPRPPRLLHLEPNVVPVEQGRAIAREVHVAAGTADGGPQPDGGFRLDAPGLRFAAGEKPLLLEVDEPDAVRTWQRTGRLADCGPGQRVYTLDAERGEVTFGNGVNGRMPPAGAQVLVSYAVCDGEEGRVARNRRWHVDGFEGAFGLNLDPIGGGAAPAASVEQRREARRRTREEHALVSADDLVAAAKAQPLLEVARAWVLPPRAGAPRTGTVTLVAMRARPDGNEPELAPETPRWLAALRRRLVGRMPLGARLVVRGPRYVDFFVTATLLGEPGRDPAKIAEAVDRELRKRLALVEPAPGGPARRPGVPVTQRDLSAWIRSVEGVLDVVELRLRRAGGRADEGEVPVPRDGLPRLDRARTRIQVRRAAPGSAP